MLHSITFLCRIKEKTQKREQKMHISFTSLLRHIRIGLIAIVFFGCFGLVEVQAADNIVQTAEDTNVIPDRFNCGATAPAEGFFIIERGSTIPVYNTDGVLNNIYLQDSGAEQKVNLTYKNKDLEGTFVFENVDFSATMDKFTILDGESRIASQKPAHFVFKNCKFTSFAGGSREKNEYVDFTFENCTFNSFWGSNAKFTRCYFGGGIGDRIIPFCRVDVQDCYIANPSSAISADGEIHVDGVQIYGWKTTEAYDIHFDGCRFELPALPYQNAGSAYVNACIMLQLEYNNGHDISFTNSYINGGGFSVYATSKNAAYTFTGNTYFKNLKFGCINKWRRENKNAQLYPKQDPNVVLNLDTWSDVDSIYVGSVMKNADGKSIDISVTNDTNQARTFKVFASSGKSYDFQIDACPLWDQINGRSFEQLPFDVVYNVPENSDWIVCYETTGGIFKQVRYVNWGTDELILTKDTKGNVVVRDKDKYTIKSVNLKQDSFVYTGKEIRPEVEVIDAKNKVVSPDNYSVKYSNNRTVGIATATVTLKGEYKGEYVKQFSIIPKSTSLKNVKRFNSKLVFSWKLKKKQVSGYQIQISTSKKFSKKSTKNFWVKHKKTTKKAINKKQIKKLKKKSLKNNKYFVRIRTYKTVKVHGKKKRILSKWSVVKKIKI